MARCLSDIARLCMRIDVIELKDTKTSYVLEATRSATATVRFQTLHVNAIAITCGCSMRCKSVYIATPVHNQSTQSMVTAPLINTTCTQHRVFSRLHESAKHTRPTHLAKSEEREHIDIVARTVHTNLLFQQGALQSRKFLSVLLKARRGRH